MRKIQDRSITRANKKKYQQEERLDRQNSFGIQDPVPQAAVNEIIRKEEGFK